MAQIIYQINSFRFIIKIADQLIVGGGIANTFIAAEGHSVGRSLYEADLVDDAKN